MQTPEGALLLAMAGELHHRGPDGVGLLVDELQNIDRGKVTWPWRRIISTVFSKYQQTPLALNRCAVGDSGRLPEKFSVRVGPHTEGVLTRHLGSDRSDGSEYSDLRPRLS